MYKPIKTKKGDQTVTQASGATAFIALMVGLIVLYFIFLPPDERAKILDEEEDEEEQSNDEVIEDKILLLEYPGRIDYLKEKTYEHDISSFYLYKTTNAKEIHSANPFIVRNGLFDEKKKEIKFTIDDLENTDNILLSFSLREYRGILSIMLNGKEVFESEISTSNPQPIRLDKKYLDEDNILEFSVSGVGIRFWSTNVYSFSDLKIVADVTDISRQEGQNTFFISENEKLNMEKARLRFIPDCTQDEVGKLEVMINYNQISSNVPDCKTVNMYSFSPAYLDSGDNQIIFKTGDGSYRVEQIRVDTFLKEITYPTYYFEINESLYKKIQDKTYDVRLSLEFVDDKRSKTMDININDRMSRIDTKESKYYKNIDRELKQGNNFIKIHPLSMLDIVEMKVELKE